MCVLIGRLRLGWNFGSQFILKGELKQGGSVAEKIQCRTQNTVNVLRRRSSKQVLLNISQYSQHNTYFGVSFQ